MSTAGCPTGSPGREGSRVTRTRARPVPAESVRALDSRVGTGPYGRTGGPPGPRRGQALAGTCAGEFGEESPRVDIRSQRGGARRTGLEFCGYAAAIAPAARNAIVALINPP